MANTIPQDQNMPQQLHRLAAQRCLYTRAKRIVAAQLVGAIVPPLLWAGLVATWPDLKAGAALTAVLLVILDLFLAQWQKHLKKQAAKVQELFDTDVLDLPWREVMAGPRPDAEDVISACRRLKKNDSSFTAFRDWYPPAIGALPLHLARIVCQRANCRWEATLRKRYSGAIIVGLVLLIVTVVLIGFIGGMTVDKLILAVVAPLLPSIAWVVREIHSQTDATEALGRLKGHLQSLWDSASRGTISATRASAQSRDIQDEIYDRRRLSPLVFDWIYRLLRRGQEEEMTICAEQMVEHYLAAHGAQPTA